MEIAIFWLFVNGLFWLLRLRPNSLVSRTAFTWLGPKPNIGESWSRYQLRWGMYSLSWLLQFVMVFSALLAVVAKWKPVEIEGFVGILMFALPIGIAMAGLAALGFCVIAAKAHLLGPNPICEIDVGGRSAE